MWCHYHYLHYDCYKHVNKKCMKKNSCTVIVSDAYGCDNIQLLSVLLPLLVLDVLLWFMFCYTINHTYYVHCCYVFCAV